MSKKQKTLLIAILPLLIATLIMLPRLFSPQFGLLDDGAMLIEVGKINAGDFQMSHDLQAGRFRPLYWLYFTFWYKLAGPDSFWFFFGQLLLLLTIIIEIHCLMKQKRIDDWQILITSLVFILSIPIIENFFTLSKGEPLQLIFLLLVLISFEKVNNSQNNRSRWLYSLLSFLSLLGALLVKETAIVMIPIVFIWTAYRFIFHKDNNNKKIIQVFIATTLAVVAFFSLRALWGAPAVTGGTYTNLYAVSLDSLILKFSRWIKLLFFYFHYLILFAIASVIAFLTIGFRTSEQKLQLFDWAVWSLLWIIVLLPWEYAEVYYLLPFSLGVAVLIGFISPTLLTFIKDKQKQHWGMKTLIFFLLLFFGATLPNYRTHALTQLMIDQVNQQMIESSHKLIPENGAFFTGLEEQTEYVQNIEYYFRDQLDRTDIYYDFVSVKTLEGLHHYSQGILLLPYIRNYPNMIVRTGVDEEFTIAWREIILYEMGDRLTEMTRFRGEFRLSNINLPVIFCPFLGEKGFCKNHDPLIDTRLFRYGWEVYQIR